MAAQEAPLHSSQPVESEAPADASSPVGQGEEGAAERSGGLLLAATDPGIDQAAVTPEVSVGPWEVPRPPPAGAEAPDAKEGAASDAAGGGATAAAASVAASDTKPAPSDPAPSGSVENDEDDDVDSAGSDGAEAERSDGDDSDDSEGLDSDATDEGFVADEGHVADDIVSLAQVDAAPTVFDGSAPNVPPPLSLPPASYPDQNLPPRTGISIPMLAASPSFIRAVPKEPEPLYQAPETLFDDIVRQEADRISRPERVFNRTVYDSVEGRPPGAGGAVEDLPSYYVPTGPDDTTLVFESRFESGNLRRAVQVYGFEYDLVLNPDYNTKSHTQWYLFRVGNTRKGRPYRFNIINMVKPTSVYNEGMRPLQYSSIEAAVSAIGWVRCGENIAYYQNGIRRKEKGSANYYTLTFSVTFHHDCDLVYFSHCYPYSYTDLQKDLRSLEMDPNVSRRFRRRKLCETLAGNACDLITVTSCCSDPAALRARRAVVMTARVHPGESNASWVMKGMLDYLTGASLDARILRDNFVFKIVPMLNPDGVIVGNYRCSLAGQDLNRLWDDPSRKMHPTIYCTKTMFRHLLNDREVILYIDIHGHSRKKNVFMYGNSECPGVREKIFPGLLCRSSDCFSFDDCCFKIQRSKESTARVVAYRELAVVNSFTLEASFCGADFGPLAEQHFTTRHLEEMGYMLCDAILDFCDPDQTKVMMVVKELQQLYPDDGNSDDVSDSEDDGATAARARRRKAKKGKREKAKKKRSAEGGALDVGDQAARGRNLHKAERSGLRRRSAPRQGGRFRDAEDAGACSDVERRGGGGSRQVPSKDAPEAAYVSDQDADARLRRSRKKKRRDKLLARGGGEGASAPPPAIAGGQGSKSHGDLRHGTADSDPRETPGRPPAVFPPLLSGRRRSTDTNGAG